MNVLSRKMVAEAKRKPKSYTQVFVSTVVMILFIASSLVAPRASFAQAPVNPAWQFQSSIYGRNVSSWYRSGVATIDYVAVFNRTDEIFNLRFSGMNNTTTFVSTKEAGGSFSISPLGNTSNRYVVTQYLNYNPVNVNGALHKRQNSDWLSAEHNQDNFPNPVIGAYVYYEYTGGTFPCGSSCNQFMAMWLGITTNTNYFMQVTAAWGDITCTSQPALQAPIFSIGYGSNLSNCPSGQSTENHQYVMQIAWDNYVTGEWYFLIYDETSQAYVLAPYYISGATGTYVASNYALEVDMEGGSTTVTGSWIPNGSQAFYNLVYWDAYGNNYNWANTPEHTQTSDTPSNVYFAAIGIPVSSIEWY